MLERYFALRIECLEGIFTRDIMFARYFSLRIECLEVIFHSEYRVLGRHVAHFIQSCLLGRYGISRSLKIESMLESYFSLKTECLEGTSIAHSR
jgi:hypothetical protein